MIVEGLGLYYTMQCQAACAHCGVWSAPDRKERMTLEQARGYIRQLGEAGTGKVVVFVGGEPLIHLEDICELIRFTKSYGIMTQVSTNAFWASTEERARRTLDKLASAGLDHLALSADSYHSEFIDPRNVGRAFAAAREFRLIRKLQVISSEVNPETTQLFESTGVDPAEVINHDIYKMNRHDPSFDATQYIILNRHPVVPFGRGSLLKGHTALLPLESLEDLPCFMVKRFPLVYPSGDLYTCCCTAGFYEEYLVGNLEQTPLRELDERMRDDVVFNAISCVGPVALAKAVQKDGAEIGRGFASPCHACREMLTRTEPEVLEKQARGLLFVHELLDGITTDSSFYEDLV